MMNCLIITTWNVLWVMRERVGRAAFIENENQKQKQPLHLTHLGTLTQITSVNHLSQSYYTQDFPIQYTFPSPQLHFSQVNLGIPFFPSSTSQLQLLRIFLEKAGVNKSPRDKTLVWPINLKVGSKRWTDGLHPRFLEKQPDILCTLDKHQANHRHL